jgi:hypothetical protein
MAAVEAEAMIARVLKEHSLTAERALAPSYHCAD